MLEVSTASVAIVVDNATAPDPLNETVGAVTSPAKEKFWLLARVLAVEALPDNAAVIVPAVKLPLPSLATIALAVFRLVAVVAELETLPAVEMVASLLSGMLACSLAEDTDRAPRAFESTAPVANFAVVTALF